MLPVGIPRRSFILCEMRPEVPPAFLRIYGECDFDEEPGDPRPQRYTLPGSNPRTPRLTTQGDPASLFLHRLASYLAVKFDPVVHLIPPFPDHLWLRLPAPPGFLAAP